MPYRPVIGIVYDPRVANPAYHMLLSRLNEFKMNTLQLDCRYDNEQHLDRLVKENISLIDGILLPGNPTDIPSELYGEERNLKWNYAKDGLLLKYQEKMIFAAKNRGMPILGICQGANVLNVVFGGKIDQDIREINKPVKVTHDVFPLKGELAHEVTVKSGTHLHDILVGNDAESRKKDLTMRVNSWHHNANKDIPHHMVVSARAPDGVIEGIEEQYPGHANCLGIQFHVEYVDEVKNPDEYKKQSRIFAAFNTACLAYHHKKDVNFRVLLQNFERKAKAEVKFPPVVEEDLLQQEKNILIPRCF